MTVRAFTSAGGGEEVEETVLSPQAGIVHLSILLCKKKGHIRCIRIKEHFPKMLRDVGTTVPNHKT